MSNRSLDLIYRLYPLVGYKYVLFLGRITVLCTYMRPIVTDRVAWSVGLSDGQSVTVVSPAKTLNLSKCRFG